MVDFSVTVAAALAVGGISCIYRSQGGGSVSLKAAPIDSALTEERRSTAVTRAFLLKTSDFGEIVPKNGDTLEIAGRSLQYDVIDVSPDEGGGTEIAVRQNAGR